MTQTREPPRPGTERLQGQLISQHRFPDCPPPPPQLFYVCDVPTPTLVNGSVPVIA